MSIRKEDLKPIIKYLKPYKREIKIAAVFVILENILLLVSPIVYGKVIDIVIKEKSFTKISILLLSLWAIFSLTNGWFGRIKDKISSKIGNAASFDLNNKSIAYLTKLPLSFHKSKKIGEIIQRFSRADEFIFRLVFNGMFQIIPDLLISSLAFIVIFWIKWQLSLIYLLFIITYLIITVRKTKPIVKQQKKLNKVMEKYYGDLFDRTSNIIAIKSSASEGTENSRNRETSKNVLDIIAIHVQLWRKVSYWQNILFTGAFISLLTSGVYFIQTNQITVGQFVMLLAYVSWLSASVNSLGNNYKQLQEGIVTIKRADKIFEEETEKYDDPEAIELESCKGNIEFKNVSFSYESEKVLEDISFKADAGSMIAIVGKSGEGKSTLVDLISRYILPTSGEITLDGIDINKIKLESLRNHIAIVPQEIDLFNDTLFNNIAYSKKNASAEEVERAAELAHCSEFIEKFPKKYEQMVGEKGVKLSTGQKQRIAIARAILRDPKILILDEATSALDSESERYVQEALETVMKGRTTFVIAHRLSTIRKADLILVIENGKIIESGDHHELITQGGVYQKLSELQQISV
ncbi:MAG: ABC transporter ATP-binding protein [bacterium]|nr:ABC transporter ATP-binding protein [bacterium]